MIIKLPKTFLENNIYENYYNIRCKGSKELINKILQ